jgi:hypothetical protein
MGLRRRGVWFVLLLLLSLGCGKSGPKNVPVSGRVTMDKRPLADADVMFLPLNPEPGKPAPESSGKTDADGRFTLKRNDGTGEGAVVGPAHVTISIFDLGTDNKPPRGQLVPRQYNAESKLTFTVPPEGSTEANFDLTGGLTGGTMHH